MTLSILVVVLIAVIVMALALRANVDGDPTAVEPVPAEELPRIPESWLDSRDNFTWNEFTSPEELREKYESGAWHTDKELQSEYGFRIVVTDEGAEYVAGELLVYKDGSLSEDEALEIAHVLGGELGETHYFRSIGKTCVTVIYPDDVDIEAMAELAPSVLPDIEASPNGVGHADV